MIAVAGATGQLGTAVRKRRGDDGRYLSRADLELTDASCIDRRSFERAVEILGRRS